VDSLSITSGKVRLCINDDETRVIEFNPNDLAFTERYILLVDNFMQRRVDLTKQLDASPGDAIPVGGLALLREAVDYFRSEIDETFGAGTSTKVFEDAYEIEMFKQFFDGIAPYVQRARAKKTGKYAKKAAPAAVMR